MAPLMVGFTVMNLTPCGWVLSSRGGTTSRVPINLARRGWTLSSSSTWIRCSEREPVLSGHTRLPSLPPRPLSSQTRRACPQVAEVRGPLVWIPGESSCLSGCPVSPLVDIEMREAHTFCIFSQRSVHRVLLQTS